MRPFNTFLNCYRGQIGQNNAGAASPQANPEPFPAQGVRSNHPSSSRRLPNWLRSAFASSNQPGTVLLNHMATEMRSAGCSSALISRFKRQWATLGNPHPDSLYARNLQADLQAHGYSPEHVQSVVDRVKMLKETIKASPDGKKARNMTKLKTLNLEYKRLQTLPPEVGQWTAMKKLDLGSNQLETLPPEVGKWTALQTLSLGNNRLQSLPNEIGQWTAMQGLSLYNNQLETLPPEVGKWTALQTLSLRNNRLQSLPNEIGRCASIQRLFLDGNQLETLPPEVGKWTALQTLSLRNNRLQSLPDEIGRCASIQGLFLDGNQLETLPDSIGNLRNLRLLDLSNNRFTHVPDALFNLPDHTEIFLCDNPLPPEEIQRVLDVLRNRREQGLPTPQLVLPLLPREINQDNALQDAMDLGLNVHARGLTETVRKRIDHLAAQFPDNLKGTIAEQKAEINAIRQRLNQALTAYEQRLNKDPNTYLLTKDDEALTEEEKKLKKDLVKRHTDLKSARPLVVKRFDAAFKKKETALDNVLNEFQYSAGHVMSYAFLAMELQWSQTPDEHLEEARANGMERLAERIAEVAADNACDTRFIEEVFQLADMPLSKYADQHPEIVGVEPIPLSRADLRDVALPAAKRVMAQILREPSSSQRSEEQEQEAFLARLTAELCNATSRVDPEQLKAYVAEEIVLLWDDFKEMAADEHPQAR